MLIEINYEIKYKYTGPVFLESNEIRIFPRNDLTQRLIDYNIEIGPNPSDKTFFMDPEGNSGLKTWFNGLTEDLSINFNCKVQTLRDNPYDFIVDFDSAKLPLKPDLNQHNRYLEIQGESREVKDFSDRTREESGSELIRFLPVLAEKIRTDFKYVIREKGPANSAAGTLENKKGACRDFAVLFCEACKYQGLASRFVSGYVFDEDDKNQSSHLHAWSEVYIPGGGWRGFDPVNGIAVSDSHIAVAASYDPSRVIPVTGSYRSNINMSGMDYLIEVKKLSYTRLQSS